MASSGSPTDNPSTLGAVANQYWNGYGGGSLGGANYGGGGQVASSGSPTDSGGGGGGGGGFTGGGGRGGTINQGNVGPETGPSTTVSNPSGAFGQNNPGVFGAASGPWGGGIGVTGAMMGPANPASTGQATIGPPGWSAAPLGYVPGLTMGDPNNSDPSVGITGLGDMGGVASSGSATDSSTGTDSGFGSLGGYTDAGAFGGSGSGDGGGGSK